jgi:hypothetical protein
MARRRSSPVAALRRHPLHASTSVVPRAALRSQISSSYLLPPTPQGWNHPLLALTYPCLHTASPNAALSPDETCPDITIIRLGNFCDEAHAMYTRQPGRSLSKLHPSLMITLTPTHLGSSLSHPTSCKVRLMLRQAHGAMTAYPSIAIIMIPSEFPPFHRPSWGNGRARPLPCRPLWQRHASPHSP